MGIRKDIQGIRAVGVVVIDHMIKWPTGGYIGVDIFFVISGFLITGLLLREHARTGRVSFADIYRRRLHRISCLWP
jgi:peptidoglycan/LPS O-acetylase OafA/YrhL